MRIQIFKALSLSNFKCSMSIAHLDDLDRFLSSNDRLIISDFFLRKKMIFFAKRCFFSKRTMIIFE